MLPSPVLSLVIPNYNFGRYLRELLLGLDSLECRDKLEVIVADGGSNDDSLSVARAFLRPHDRLLIGPDNGQADAISKGLAASNGDWFMFQNSDDLFDFGTLDAFLRDPPTLDLCDVVAYDQEFLIEGPEGWSRIPAFRHRGTISWRQLYWSIYFTNQATIYDRSKAQQTDFDRNKRFAMDYDFVVRFFKNYDPKVHYPHRTLGIQRLHDDTKTSTLQPVCRAETAEVVRRQFNLYDCASGFVQAAVYHARKRLERRHNAKS